MKNYLVNSVTLHGLLFSASFWALISPALAEPLSVITANGTAVSSLTRDEVADLFLGRRKISIDGQTLIPLDASDDKVRDSFYQAIADMSAVRVSAYWARIVFAAQGRPPRKLPLDEVKFFLQSQPGTVTYAPDAKHNGFKILLSLP
jgi:hypothetical protein